MTTHKCIHKFVKGKNKMDKIKHATKVSQYIKDNKLQIIEVTVFHYAKEFHNKTPEEAMTIGEVVFRTWMLGDDRHTRNPDILALTDFICVRNNILEKTPQQIRKEFEYYERELYK